MAQILDETTQFQELLGYRLLEWREGFALMDQPLRPELGNRSGIPHGGVYATLLDTAMGYTGCWVPEGERVSFALTLSLTVNFIAQPSGPRLICEARKTGGGRNVFYAEAKITDESGRLIAAGSGVFRMRSKPASVGEDSPPSSQANQPKG